MVNIPESGAGYMGNTREGRIAGRRGNEVQLKEASVAGEDRKVENNAKNANNSNFSLEIIN